MSTFIGPLEYASSKPYGPKRKRRTKEQMQIYRDGILSRRTARQAAKKKKEAAKAKRMEDIRTRRTAARQRSINHKAYLKVLARVRVFSRNNCKTLKQLKAQQKCVKEGFPKGTSKIAKMNGLLKRLAEKA